MRLLLSLLLFSLLITTVAQSEIITGKVASIADGYTLTILESNKTNHKIGLYGIDSLKKAEAFGDVGKKCTAMFSDNYNSGRGIIIVADQSSW
jgi:endonuclease YncB( thermonuclease family)